MLCFILCYAALLVLLYCNVKFNIMLRKLVLHFAPSWHGYCITNKDCYIKLMMRMSTNQLIMTLIDYTDYYVVTIIHESSPACYAGIMLDAFNNIAIICSKLCWHDKSGPTHCVSVLKDTV